MKQTAFPFETDLTYLTERVKTQSKLIKLLEADNKRLKSENEELKIALESYRSEVHHT